VIDKRCPDETHLVKFVDEDLSPEQLQRIQMHLEQCSKCALQVSELRELIGDIGASPKLTNWDVAAHVASVMQRIDAPAPASARLTASGGRTLAQRFWVLGAGLSAAAMLSLFVFSRGTGSDGHAEFAARGGVDEPSLSRDVGVQLYIQATSVHALTSGARIFANDALTAGLRNLGKHQAHLLLFAIDSKQEVHWIAPAYTVLGTDPQAAPVAPGARERLLPSSATFDGLAPGPLRVIAVITREATHVSSVERLPVTELTADGLLKRFPRAEVRQFLLEVTP
jgi:Putative zinc-finger